MTIKNPPSKPWFTDAQKATLFAGAAFLLLSLMQLGTTYFNSRSAQMAAVEVREVKATLETQTAKTDTQTAKTDEKLDSIDRTVDMVHTLVNSGSVINLRLLAVAHRRVADLSKEPEDIETAKATEALLKEHEKKQADANNKHGQGK